MMTIEMLLRLALRHHASDLHLRAGSSPLIRVYGRLLPLPGCDGETNYAEMLLTLLTEQQLHLFERYHDLDFAYELPEIGRFRVNLQPGPGRNLGSRHG